MKRIVLESKPKQLIFRRTDKWYILLDVKPEYTDEKKFVNSAFVKTGRKVPTGKYTAIELKFHNGLEQLPFILMKSEIIKSIEKMIEETILSGFVWNNYKVWLSKENQQNYSSWVSAAKMDKNILPFTAKFNIGLLNDVVYYDFGSVEELEDFYTKMVKFINDTVNLGRKMKDEFKENELIYRESISI